MEPLLVKRDSCPLCTAGVPVKGERFFIRQLDQVVRVIECPVCGLVYKETQPTSRCLDFIYKGLYAHHSCACEGTDWGAPEYVRRMRLPKGGRHLDYGCGNGNVVLHARGAGIESVGIDPFLPDFLQQGKNVAFFHKLTAECAQFQEMGCFDAISMWAVIEHLENPLETVKGLARVLKTGGHLFFNAPNADSWIARKDGGHWAIALLVEHSTFWTKRAVNYLASASGLRVQAIIKCGVPYPLNKRSADWASFGVTIDCESRHGTDGQVPLNASDEPSFMATYSRRLLMMGRKAVKHPCVGHVVRKALQFTGMGDHYNIIFEKE